MTAENEKLGLDFYRSFRDRIHQWAKQKGKNYEYLEYLLLAPDFFYLLVKLMLEDRVPLKAKAKVGVVIVYYLSPFDIIPEFMLGPVGFADDLVLAVWTVNSLIKSVDRQVLIDNWPAEQNLFESMEQILAASDKWLGKGAYQKLKTFFMTKIMGK